jgi:hypothetical protein
MMRREAELFAELEISSGMPLLKVFARVREIAATMGLDMAQVEAFIAPLERSAIRSAHFEQVARNATQLVPPRRTQRPPRR